MLEDDTNVAHDYNCEQSPLSNQILDDISFKKHNEHFISDCSNEEFQRVDLTDGGKFFNWTAKQKFIDFLCNDLWSENPNKSGQQDSFVDCDGPRVISEPEIVKTIVCVEGLVQSAHCRIQHARFQGKSWGGKQRLNLVANEIYLKYWKITSQVLSDPIYIFGVNVEGSNRYITFVDIEETFEFNKSDKQPSAIGVREVMKDKRAFYCRRSGNENCRFELVCRPGVFAKYNVGRGTVVAGDEDIWKRPKSF